MKRLFTFCCAIFPLLFCGFAQKSIQVDHSCNFVGQLAKSEVYIFPSEEEAKNVFMGITKYVSLPINFTIKAANVSYAAAVISRGERYLLYNQNFMDQVKNSTDNDWFSIGILAHEIGHHQLGHTFADTSSRLHSELEADKFSGFVLFKMGATLEEAMAAIESIASRRGNSTQPPKSARLAAISDGWLSARELRRKEQTDEFMVVDVGNSSTENVKAGYENIYETRKVPNARLERMWVEHNVVKEGKKGMRIHAKFAINNLKNKRCMMIAWFYHKNGDVLKDLDQSYYTPSGQVSAYSYFTPTYDRATVTDLGIFIPYDQLHCAGAEKYDLKFMIGLHRKGKRIGNFSKFIGFWYQN